MKKIFVFLLVLMLFFVMSCGKGNEHIPGDDNITQSDNDAIEAPDSPEDNQPEDNQPEDNQPEDNQPEDNQPEDNQPEDNQPEDNQPEDNQPEDNQPEDNQPEDNQPEDNQPEDNQPEDNQPEDNQPEHNHNYNAIVTAPTCTSEGYTTYTCTCGSSYVSDRVGTANHTYSSTVTSPTCTAGGYTTYTCSACGDRYTGNITSAKGHTELSIPAVEATCTSTGLTEGKKCSVCDTTTVPQQTVATKSHSYTSSVTAPTCTEGGFTTYTCSVCSYTYIGNNTSAKGHTELSIPAVEATCTSTGLTEGKKCSVCDTTTVPQQTVATKSHSYTSSVTAPTCTEGGFTTYTCSVCSYTYIGNNTSAKGHTPGSAATCTNAQTCTVCNVTITVALGHSWVDATTEAPKTCITCGATEGEKLPSSTPTTLPTLYVNYINVGQGDSILIKAGDCDILIDAGTASYGSTVSSYLSSKGVDDIELMINTHPDSDHCGGLTQVLTDFIVEQVWISKDTSKTTAAYTNFISAVGKEGLSAKQPNAGAVFTYEYLTITVLYSAKGSDANNSSIVVMLEYGSFKFLFTGDAGSEVESQLVSSGADLSCDVLKVGHHGSAGSSTASFLNATGAEYGVICVGNNSYGHPTATALNNLSAAGISVYRTDLNGNVVFSTNGATLYLPGGGSDTSGSGSSGDSGLSGGTSGATQYFIGNTETKVFHLPTCSNLPSASKQNVMYNYSWIVNIAGYTPCGRCLKNYSGSDGGSTVSYIANTESKVYHLSTCSYLPAASKQQVIYSTTGYTPCGHCIKGSSSVSYIANTESKVYHLSTCSYLPAASKQEIIYSTSGYTPCGHCIKK